MGQDFDALEAVEDVRIHLALAFRRVVNPFSAGGVETVVIERIVPPEVANQRECSGAAIPDANQIAGRHHDLDLFVEDADGFEIHQSACLQEGWSATAGAFCQATDDMHLEQELVDHEAEFCWSESVMVLRWVRLLVLRKVRNLTRRMCREASR